jgi:DNA-binding NtrC family response regulator
MSLPPAAYASDRLRTILLVEDEPFVREATCNILQHAGFTVFSTGNAQQAIQVYDDRSTGGDGGSDAGIDLVMTDMVLPGPSGQQLGEQLRQRSPEVLVLVTSGYFNPEYETEEPESHTYFLAKPYSRRTLLDKIDKILGPTAMARAAKQAG